MKDKTMARNKCQWKFIYYYNKLYLKYFKDKIKKMFYFWYVSEYQYI